MKKFILFFIAIIMISCSSPVTEEVDDPTATVSITNIYSSGNYVYVYYDITNTGNCNICVPDNGIFVRLSFREAIRKIFLHLFPDHGKFCERRSAGK